MTNVIFQKQVGILYGVLKKNTNIKIMVTQKITLPHENFKNRTEMKITNNNF